MITLHFLLEVPPRQTSQHLPMYPSARRVVGTKPTLGTDKTVTLNMYNFHKMPTSSFKSKMIELDTNIRGGNELLEAD